MVLVYGDGLVRAQAERLDGVGVVLTQQILASQVVDLRGALLCLKLRRILVVGLQLLAVLVRGLGVGGEVVVEGDVLAVDDDDVLDGSLRLGLSVVGGGNTHAAGGCSKQQGAGGGHRRDLAKSGEGLRRVHCLGFLLR